MSKPNNHRMIRVPVELAERIEKLQADYLEAYQNGQTSRVVPSDQGTKGFWVSKAEIIRIALDDLEDHRARSRKK